MSTVIQNIKFTASKSSGEVSGILIIPDKAKFLLVFGHGAGAGMKHPFMRTVSNYLADEGIATLRYNFPYTEKKIKRPDPAPILMETVRSAVKAASEYAGDIPLLAGGKSLGGRMTSMAASNPDNPPKADGMEKVKGIVFFGFPLHAPGKPSNERAEHLYNVKVPMLFLQGTRDKLADLDLLKPVIKKLGDKATLHIIEGADHSFHLLKSSGRSDEDVLKELAKKVAEWGRGG
jgi:predicted alpha/beta-hydrolase family hydrolase